MKCTTFTFLLMLVCAANAQTAGMATVIKQANGLASDRILGKMSLKEFCQKATPLFQQLVEAGVRSTELRAFDNLFNKRDKCPFERRA